MFFSSAQTFSKCIWILLRFGAGHRGTWLWQWSATSASSPSASGSGPECCGLKQASLAVGWPTFTPFFSFLLKCTLFLPTLLTANEPHQAIKSWSKIKDEKEGQLEFQLLLLLFSFEQVRRLCNRQRYRQWGEWPHLPTASPSPYKRCANRSLGGKRKSPVMSLVRSSWTCLLNISLELQALPTTR